MSLRPFTLNNSEVVMEHRQGARIAVAKTVQVSFKSKPMGHVLTCNLSHGGMLLQAGLVEIQPGDPVRLQLSMNGRRRDLSALVVHNGEDGVGVMLTVSDPEYSSFFLGLLERHQHARACMDGSLTEGELKWAKDSASLVLRLGERLDVSVCPLIEQAIESIRTRSVQSVVIDFTATRKIFDSGMALLLLLHERAGHLENQIYVANCAPRVLGRLARAGIACHFRIAADHADRGPPGQAAASQSERRTSTRPTYARCEGSRLTPDVR